MLSVTRGVLLNLFPSPQFSVRAGEVLFAESATADICINILTNIILQCLAESPRKTIKIIQSIVTSSAPCQHVCYVPKNAGAVPKGSAFLRAVIRRYLTTSYYCIICMPYGFHFVLAPLP